MKLYNRISGRLLAMALLSSALVIGTSCSDDDDNNSLSTHEWEANGNVVVDIKPDRTSLQRNPMQGWVLYAGLGDGLVDDFWEQYDNFDSSEGKVKVSDYANTLYIRGAWSDFNPEEGVYVWQDNCNTKPAQRFKMLVKGAKERNLKLAFTFVVDTRDKHYNFTPDYVMNAINKEYGKAGWYEAKTGSFTGWSPYPDNPIFQKYYAKFLTDFAAVYDDPDVTQFVSGFGLGMWGETHTLLYSTGDDTPKWAVFEWISDLMSSLFKRVPIVINYHRCILTGQGFNSNTDMLADSEKMLDKAVEKGFSLRHDAFGMKSYYTTWERGFATKYRYIRPFIMEGGWVEASHGNSIKGDGYNNFAEVRQGEYDEAKGANVNMMDLRYSSSVNSGETYSWFNSAFKLVKSFIAEGGYRLYPDKVSVPTTIGNGANVSITHRWSNLGWGYCPTNIPQWNQKYKVCFALLDKATEQPVYKYVDQEPCLNDWVKGTPYTYDTHFNVGTVASGEYVWAVGLVDTTKDCEIGIQIAARENVTADGWLKLHTVTVR